MREALGLLDSLLPRPVTFILGGGGALALAHHFPLSTHDLDAIPKGMSQQELQPYVLQVAQTLKLSNDWINPYFSSFTHTLPPDFATRLIRTFSGKQLSVDALGKNDLLIMKCFAHRPKDVAHARVLIQQGADVVFVEDHIDQLIKKRLPGAKEASEFLADILNQSFA